MNILKKNSNSILWLLEDKFRRATLVYNFDCLDPLTTSVLEYQKMGMYLMELATDKLRNQEMGVVLVFDCRRLRMSHCTSFTLDDARRGAQMWQDAFPCRLARILIIGLSTVCSSFVSLGLRTLPAKLRNRVSFLSTEELASELGPETLPLDLGGTLPFDWAAKVDAHISQSQEPFLE